MRSTAQPSTTTNRLPRGAHHSRWRRGWPSGHMPRSVCCKHCEDYALRATRPAPCVSMLKRRPIVGPTDPVARGRCAAVVPVAPAEAALRQRRYEEEAARLHAETDVQRTSMIVSPVGADSAWGPPRLPRRRPHLPRDRHMCSSGLAGSCDARWSRPWETPAHFDAEPTRSPPCRLYARLVQAELRERASLLDTALCLGGADVDVLCDALLALAENAGVDGLLEGTRAWRAMLRCAATCGTVLQHVGLCCNMLDCVATLYTVLQPGVAGLNVLIEGASAAAAAVPHCWSGRHLRRSHWLSRTCSERGVCAYRNGVGPQRAEHMATVGEAQPIRGWTAWHRRVGWLQQAEHTSPAHEQARKACVCMCWLQRRVHSAPSTERR